MAQPRHAFLSYCHDDKELVRALRHELSQNGLATWWDDEILPGQDWKREVRKALSVAYAVLVCLSRNLNVRDHSGVYPELLSAIEELRNRRPGEIFVIPVRLNDCEIPDVEIDATRTLKSIQYVDLFPDSERKKQIARLVTVLRQKAGQDGSLPVGPVKRSRITVTINMEQDDFDKRSENTLRFGLANFLDVPLEEISIIAIEEGSVKVILEFAGACGATADFAPK
jgi:hypothetical protein